MATTPCEIKAIHFPSNERIVLKTWVDACSNRAGPSICILQLHRGTELTLILLCWSASEFDFTREMTIARCTGCNINLNGYQHGHENGMQMVSCMPGYSGISRDIVFRFVLGLELSGKSEDVIFVGLVFRIL